MVEKTASDKRTRRYIFVNDTLYKMVAKESIEKNIDYGSVIDKALILYFKGERE